MNTEPQMTPEQLKIQSLEAEIARLRDKDTKIEYRSKENYEFDKWDLCELSELFLKDNYNRYYYRIAQPKKEKKFKRVPLDMSDFDGVATVWVRSYGFDDRLVTSIGVIGVRMVVLCRTYKELHDYNCTYSSDRKNWKPCYKEVEVEE